MRNFVIDSMASAVISPSPAPEWKRKMDEDYARTGACRIEDIHRAIGDQTRTLRIGGSTDNTNSFYLPRS
jgi:hypothetical protein